MKKGNYYFGIKNERIIKVKFLETKEVEVGALFLGKDTIEQNYFTDSFDNKFTLSEVYDSELEAQVALIYTKLNERIDRLERSLRNVSSNNE